MTDRQQGWLTAASCHEGPAPTARFADLPHEHQNEIVRVGLLAAASTAFFIGVGMILTPLPSRNLASHAVLPHAMPVRPAVLEARLTVPAADVAPPRALRGRTVRLRPSIEAATLRMPVAANV